MMPYEIELYIDKNRPVVNKWTIQSLLPFLERDEAHANASFGPLSVDYLELRMNALTTWQPATLGQIETVITLARLNFKRRLVHQETQLFYSEINRRSKELDELSRLTREIERLTASMQSELNHQQLEVS